MDKFKENSNSSKKRKLRLNRVAVRRLEQSDPSKGQQRGDGIDTFPSDCWDC